MAVMDVLRNGGRYAERAHRRNIGVPLAHCEMCLELARDKWNVVLGGRLQDGSRRSGDGAAVLLQTGIRERLQRDGPEDGGKHLEEAEAVHSGSWCSSPSTEREIVPLGRWWSSRIVTAFVK